MRPSRSGHPVVLGEFGVGKTSLVNVVLQPDEPGWLSVTARPSCRAVRSPNPLEFRLVINPESPWGIEPVSYDSTAHFSRPRLGMADRRDVEKNATRFLCAYQHDASPPPPKEARAAVQTTDGQSATSGVGPWQQRDDT